MGDTQRFILTDIVIAILSIIVAVFWDFLQIRIVIEVNHFSVGGHQVMIIGALVAWLLVSLNRLRYYS